MTTGKHSLLVKGLAVTCSVSIDQIIGIYSWMSSAFCNAVYNRKVTNVLYYSSLGKEAVLHLPVTVTGGKKYYVCDSVLNRSWCTRL